MGDSLLIHDLVLHAFHGVHEAESRHGQRFVMDLIVEADFRAAAAEDAYEKAICYDRLINDVSALFTQSWFWSATRRLQRLLWSCANPMLRSPRIFLRLV
jgi:FolB domain-containing protein